MYINVCIYIYVMYVFVYTKCTTRFWVEEFIIQMLHTNATLNAKHLNYC